MTSSGHNMAAPGFSQTFDPFAALKSGNHDDIDEALNFEDTYDGLGDQLDETDDAFNDDTFGGGDENISKAPVGKDFDFFGHTAKVTDAIEEEHARFTRQQPIPKSAYQAVPQQYGGGYAYQQAPRPARSGYEKYKDPEPVAELQVDASIWGSAPRKTATPTAVPQHQQAVPAAARKMMSLEEVEAAMRAQSKPTAASSSAQAHPQQQFDASEVKMPTQPGYYPPQEMHDVRRQPIDDRQQQAFHPNEYSQGTSHGHPITILQRPSSKHAPPTAPGAPSPLSQHQQAAPNAPTQILQNPMRMAGDASRVGQHTHAAHRAQNSFSRHQQTHSITHPSQLSEVSEQQKAAFLEADARRAKRNHKIFVLSKENGLMTPQDKSFITRIQLQQLVSATGDPSEYGSDAALTEDFYYQVLSSLRAGQRTNPREPLTNFAQTYLFQTGTRHSGNKRHGRGPENHVQRMEQQVQRAVEAAKNKPKNKQLVIEGSLGKISFSNAKTPKPLLNIKRADSGNDVNRPGSAHRAQVTDNGADIKVTLRDIESVYQILMKMEDLARNMPPPPMDGQPSQEFVERQAEFQILNEQMWKDLKVHEPINKSAMHPFIRFISYAKGKKAIPRVFRHLTPTQRTTILTMIIVQLDQLDVIRGAQIQTGEPTTLDSAMREKIELYSSTVVPALFQLINESELDIVAGVLGLICQNPNLYMIARSRVGVSLFTMLLSRAELLKEANQVNDLTWQEWSSAFNHFFNAIEPTLPYIFPGTVISGEDIYVWQFLAAIGIGASPDEQQRLVLAVKDRVMDTVSIAKTLPPEMAKERLGSVNLFMQSIGLDVELLG